MPPTAATTAAPPLTVIPMSVRVECPRCRERSNLPSAAVGLTVPCPVCGARLTVTLTTESDTIRVCGWCDQPMPPTVGRDARYCSDQCRLDVRTHRRRTSRAARRAS